MDKSEALANRHETKTVPYLPEIIDTPYPYVSMRDLYETSMALAPSMPRATVAHLEDILQEIKELVAPEGSTFYGVESDTLNILLEKRVEEEIDRSDVTVGVIHMDRYVGMNQCGPNVIRLDISRDSSKQLTSRVGVVATIERQLMGVVNWADAIKPDEIIFVDDVVAFGDTLPVIADMLREAGLPNDIKLRALVGMAASGGSWNGLEKMQDTAGIDTEYLTKILASPEIQDGSLGMAIPVSRDLTVLGGKVSTRNDGSKRIHPYMLPFSRPLASIIRPEIQIDASRKLLAFSLLLIETIEQHIGHTLYIQDLEDKDLGIPATSLDFLNDIMEDPDKKTSISDYIGYALDVLDKNEELILQKI